MAFEKLISKIRTSWDNAVYGEGTADRQRKTQVAQQLADFSAAITSDGSDDYTSRLKAIFLELHTRTLDKLVKANVAVSLDDRIAQQPNDHDRLIGAVYYPVAPGAPAGGIIAFRNNKGDDFQTGENAQILRTFPSIIGQTVTTGPVYAVTTRDDVFGSAAYGDGAKPGFPTTWVFDSENKAVQENPALAKPPALKAAALKA